MLDFTRHGKRWSAKRIIRRPAGTIEQLGEGTIAFEVENLGRQLIFVQWDTGVATYVFDDEVKIIEGDECTTWQ
jgi:hypothetical protein